MNFVVETSRSIRLLILQTLESFLDVVARYDLLPARRGNRLFRVHQSCVDLRRVQAGLGRVFAAKSGQELVVRVPTGFCAHVLGPAAIGTCLVEMVLVI